MKKQPITKKNVSKIIKKTEKPKADMSEGGIDLDAWVHQTLNWAAKKEGKRIMRINAKSLDLIEPDLMEIKYFEALADKIKAQIEVRFLRIESRVIESVKKATGPELYIH